MSRATVELDFFGMEKEISAKPPFPKFHRQRSLLAISKMNPEILKSVIASGSSSSSSNQQNGRNQFDSTDSLSVPEDRSSFPVLPVYSPLPTPTPKLENPAPTPAPTAPLTIFYNGTVVVFDVHQDKAEAILKLAEKGNCKSVESESGNQQRPVDGVVDLSGSRKMSLQRFLEKRKERLTYASPYASKP